jgi:hypothetical protein
MKRARKKPKHQPLPEPAYEDPQFMESLPARPFAFSPNTSIL